MIVNTEVVDTYFAKESLEETKNHWIFNSIVEGEHLVEEPKGVDEDKLRSTYEILIDKLKNFEPLNICTDMEGASGIFEENYRAMIHGTEEWRKQGRECITSDVLAVCEAANEFGIDEILIYYGHFAGSTEPNIITEKLPDNAKLFDTPDRCFWWRRIRL